MQNRLVPQLNGQGSWGKLTHLLCNDDKVDSLLRCEVVAQFRSYVLSFHPEDASSTFHRNVTSTKQRGETSDKEVSLIKNLINSTYKKITSQRLRSMALSASICHHVRSVFIHCRPLVHEQIKDNALRSKVWVPLRMSPVQTELYPLLTLTQLELNVQYHSPVVLPQGNNTDTHWRGGWVGLRAGTDALVIQKNPVSILVIGLFL